MSEVPLEVTKVTALRRSAGLVPRWHLDRPRPGEVVDARELVVTGWAFPGPEAITAVELVHDGRVLRRIPLGRPRPDLEAAFPEVPGAGAAGFRAALSLVAAGRTVDLRLQAVLAGHGRVPLAQLAVVPRWAPPEAAEVVSVVIPCRRQARLLPETLESVLTQTHPHVEVLVVDRDATDNTVEVVGRYPGVRHLELPGSGLGAACGAGVDHTRGEHLVVAEPGDRLRPGALAAGLAALRTARDADLAAGRWAAGATGEPRPALLGPTVVRPAALLHRRRAFDELRFDESGERLEPRHPRRGMRRPPSPVEHEHVVVEHPPPRAPPGADVAARDDRSPPRWPEGVGAADVLVSIVVVVGDAREHLAATVADAVRQTHPAVEVVLLGSPRSAELDEVVTRHAGVRAVRAEGLGPQELRNLGIRRSTGELLAFVAPPDRLRPDAIAAGLACLRAHPDAAGAVGLHVHEDADGSAPPAAFVCAACGGSAGALLLRRSVLERVDPFWPAARAAAPLDLAQRVAGRFGLAEHDGVVVARPATGGWEERPGELLPLAAEVLRAGPSEDPLVARWRGEVREQLLARARALKAGRRPHAALRAVLLARRLAAA